MTKQDATKYFGIPGAVIALAGVLALVLALAGFATKSDLHAVETRQQQINDEILRKLDCALWDLPRGCRETMSPRQP